RGRRVAGAREDPRDRAVVVLLVREHGVDVLVADRLELPGVQRPRVEVDREQLAPDEQAREREVVVRERVGRGRLGERAEGAAGDEEGSPPAGAGRQQISSGEPAAQHKEEEYLSLGDAYAQCHRPVGTEGRQFDAHRPISVSGRWLMQAGLYPRVVLST